MVVNLIMRSCRPRSLANQNRPRRSERCPGGGRSGCWCARRPAGAAGRPAGGEPGRRVTAALDIQVGLVQVRA